MSRRTREPEATVSVTGRPSVAGAGSAGRAPGSEDLPQVLDDEQGGSVSSEEPGDQADVEPGEQADLEVQADDDDVQAEDVDVQADEVEDAAAVNAAAVADLWRRFKDTGDQALREKLILHYSPLVKYVAGQPRRDPGRVVRGVSPVGSAALLDLMLPRPIGVPAAPAGGHAEPSGLI